MAENVNAIPGPLVQPNEVPLRRRPGLLARMLFAALTLLYGRRDTLAKFKGLEIIARVPYQAWENVAYVALTHRHTKPGMARRIFEFVEEARQQQDNEQWHLLILTELVQQQGQRPRLFRDRLLPQLLALFYYHASWVLYVLKPRWCYRLNAEFEDHAERAYLAYVRAHPELEHTPWESELAADYGAHETVADLLRQIALDERHHKEESLARMAAPRFA